MASSGEQQLLYSLRSPTTPLNDKLALATSSLSTIDSSISTSALPQLIRDWLLDTLFKLVRSSSATTEQALLNGQLWELLSSTTEATSTSSTSTPLLPVYVAFIQVYSSSAVKDKQVLKEATRIWSKLAANAMRKATVDAVLDGYEKLVKATLQLRQAGTEEVEQDWDELAVNWLKAVKSVFIEAAKGGKKVPSHTLNLLPSLIPLLQLLSPSSPVHSTLLQTIQIALFNLDNLRRGLARDSYASGGSATTQSSSASTTTADSELLASLSSLSPALSTSLYASLPSLTHIYLNSLFQNSATLFPLPAKATFPTPSAQKSALEVLGLGKRRELAGRWIKGVVELVEWTSKSGTKEESETEKALALAQVLAEIEEGDLYRPGQGGEVWEGILPSIAEGAVERLVEISTADAARRDAAVEVLSSVHRLEYEVLDKVLPRVLAVLSRTPNISSESSSAISTFLSLLLTHHSRSLTMPTFLVLLSDALASSSYSTPNNLLTTFSFTSQLSRTISGMLSSSSSIRSTWENLLSPITANLLPSHIPSDGMSIDQDDSTSTPAEGVPSPAKKRKLSSVTSTSDPTSVLSSAARLRVLTTFISHLPTPALSSLVERFKTFTEELVDSNVKEFVKAATTSSSENGDPEGTPSKKSKKSKRKSVGLVSEKKGLEPVVVLGVELSEARYAIVSRLNVSGLLPTEEEGGDWTLMKDKRREGLREIVKDGSKEAVVVSARLLLQQLELAADSPPGDASSTLDTILARLRASSIASAWSGNLRSIKNDEVSIALWEMISRRWMVVFESLASDEQLKQLVAVIIKALGSSEGEASHDNITRRLFKRADFWELASLQTQLRTALLNLVSLPSLTSPASFLSILSESSSSKSASSLKSISTDTLLSTSRTFSRFASFVPLEYLGREYRSQLAEPALSLDLWISAGGVEMQASSKEAAQAELRRFVGYMGSVVDQSPQVLAQLVLHTLPGAKLSTLALYRSLIQTSLSTFSDSKSPAELLSFLRAFGEKPLADLAKRAKKDETLSQGLTCEESAYALLLELLATSLGEVSSLPSELADTIRSSFKAASKPFGKALAAVTSARTTTDPFLLGDLSDATRAIWTTKDWLAGTSSASDEQDSLCAEYTQTILTSTISQLPASIAKPSALPACLSLLELLSYRIKRLRVLSSEEKLLTEPFETLIASHLLFRQSFGTKAAASLDSNLIKATASATLREYTIALEGISSAVSSAASANDTTASMNSLPACLSIAMILLRDGPDGSVKLSSSALSELLRHLSLLVETFACKPDQDEQTAQTYLLVATFLDSVCADRPMLLSRLNVSSVLSLVSRILQPSPAYNPSSTSRIASETASSLLRTLASTVGHIVRHRKDHVVPLFPQLVSTLSAFLSILRRVGFGSTGLMSTLEEADTGIVLGQRAEREARATFPAWAWQGGAKGIHRAEAAAVGRLLGSLTAKTTVIQHKNHKPSKPEDATTSSTSTTSLTAPLSKHAPFLLLAYLRSCVHPTCPIPSALRGELQGGWFEVMDSMGKWEREALMKGFLTEDEEAERGILRDLWKSWEKERYRG